MRCAKCEQPLQQNEQQCPRCGASLHSEDPRIGERIAGSYLLERRIGLGGNSAVYQARDQRDGRLVALKLLRADVSQKSEVLARFRREAQISAKLSHPSIVKLLSSGEEPDGLLWIAMELLQGETLDERLKRQPRYTEAELLALLQPLCEALEEAHQLQIYHRDLKPQNIFLARQGDTVRPVLLDFGMAALRSEDGLTQSEIVSGTPRYMAPEQWEGLKFADARSDVYALGVIAYRCVSGEFPFEADSALAWMKKHSTESPRSLSAVMSGAPLSKEIEATVMQALAKQPADRPQSAAAFWRALREEPQQEPLLLRPPHRWSRRATLLSVASGVGALLAGRLLLKRDEPAASAFANAAPLSTTTCASLAGWLMPLSIGSWWKYRVSESTSLRAEPEPKLLTIDAYEELRERPGVFGYRLRRKDSGGYADRWILEQGGRIEWLVDEWYDQDGKPTTGRYYYPGRLRVDQRCEHIKAGALWEERYTQKKKLFSSSEIIETHDVERWSIESEAEEIVVPAGRFTCIRVLRVSETTRTQSTYWFAPSVGKVKELSPPKELEELLDYHIAPT